MTTWGGPLVMDAAQLAGLATEVAVEKSGTLVGTRHTVNLIPGTNITLTVADNAGSDRVDVTVDAAGAANTIGVENNGTAVGTEPNLNLIAGSNVTLTIADNPGSSRVDVTIAASGGSTSAITQIFDSTLSSPAASFDITSIAGTYTALLVYWYLRSTRVAVNDNIIGRLNNDSGANYLTETSNANNTSVAAAGATATGSPVFGVATAASATAGRFAAGTLFLPNYAGTTGHKIVAGQEYASWGTTAASQYVQYQGAVWANTAAVTRLTLLPSTGPNWDTGSRVTVYGLS